MDDAGKQTLADTVGTGLMLLLANLESAKPAERDQAKQAVRGVLRTTLGLDVAQLALTPQGLVAISPASKTAQPAADKTGQAAACTCGSESAQQARERPRRSFGA